jgi:hypothetical protein
MSRGRACSDLGSVLERVRWRSRRGVRRVGRRQGQEQMSFKAEPPSAGGLGCRPHLAMNRDAAKLAVSRDE